MNEWKEYKLGEVVAFGNGKVRPAIKGEIPVYGGNGILDYCSTHNYLDETVIIGRVGAYCGSVYYENKPIWVSDNALAAKPKNGYNAKFLYYYLTNLRLNEFAEGSSHPLVTQTLLNSIDVRITNNIEEQKRIAGILSSLDDKIDLLGRQNATLEALAQTLFRHHFIDDPKPDWKETTLSSYVNCINGVSYTSDELRSSTTAMATLKSFHRDGGFKMDGYKEYTGKYKESQIIHEGDLLVAHTDITQDAAVIGNPVLVISTPQYHQLTFSMDLVKVEPIGCLSKELLYLLMRSCSFKEHCLGYANGSTVLHLSKKAIPEYEFYMPTSSIVDMLQHQVVPLVDKIFTNHKQIISLTTIRDTLLPKLMNNELKI